MRRPGVFIVALCVVALRASADEPGDAPLERPDPTVAAMGRATQPRRSFLIPAIESEILHLGFLTFSNLVTRESFAQISLDTIKSHFDGRAPWTFDVDYFLTNQFGHPYQGALAFTAARSAGLNFWWSCLYPFLSSLAWELVYEVDPPSLNDQITTTLGGIFLGEVLHRSADLILNNGLGPESFLRQLFAFLIEPMGAVNRFLFDDQLHSGTIERHPQFFGMLGAGVAVGSFLVDRDTQQRLQAEGIQVTVQGLITYGNPGDPSFRYRYPFSHFDLSAGVSFPQTSTSYLFIRGLLAGGQYGTTQGSFRGVWGLFGQYDFAAATFVRVSSVGLGPGTTFQWQLSEQAFLQTTAVLSAVPYASGGSLGLDEELYRDYHIGPGFQAVLEARLIHRQAGMLRLTGRTWYLVGAYVPPSGFESINYLTASLLVKLYGHFAAGLDLTIAARRSKFEDFTYDRNIGAGVARFTLSYMSDEDFGAVEPLPSADAERRRLDALRLQADDFD